MTKREESHVVVRRRFNDYNAAEYRLEDIGTLQWSNVSGGVQTRANREYLCGYVWCNRAVAGEVSHSGAHGDCPHRIKVCILKKDNKEVYARVLNYKEWQDCLKECSFAVDLGDRAVDVSEMDAWLSEHADPGAYHKVDLGWWDPGFEGKGPKGLQLWFASSETAQAFANRFMGRLMHHQNAEKRNRAALL
jgi:hypothetical protein